MSSTVHSLATDQEKQPRPESNSAIVFPEGGLSGWLTVLGSLSDFWFWLEPHKCEPGNSALILFSTFGVSLSFGVLEDHYTVWRLSLCAVILLIPLSEFSSMIVPLLT
jgi:hypothetical protein